MTRKSRPTDTAIKIVRGLPSAVKVVLATGTILATLYGGVRFVVDVEFERHERARQKVGRQEYSKNRDRVAQQLEQLDDRVDRIEAQQAAERR